MPEKNEKELNEERVETLKELEKRWYKNPSWFLASFILGPIAIFGGSFVPLGSTWEHWLQTALFLAGAGFFLLPISYVFSYLWRYLLNKTTPKE